MRYNPHTRHTDAYYKAIGLVVIHGHKTGQTGRQIVQALQATGLPSPTGNPWTLDGYKSLLARIRSQAGNTFVGLLRGLLAGDFTRDDVRLLMGRL
jgi:hypothetical protein